jgi:hypothetical protein
VTKDVTDPAQLPVFIQGVNEDFQLVELPVLMKGKLVLIFGFRMKHELPCRENGWVY